jgi:hypothetical protein
MRSRELVRRSSPTRKRQGGLVASVRRCGREASLPEASATPVDNRMRAVAAFAIVWGITASAFWTWTLVRHLLQHNVDASFALFAVFPLFAFAAAYAQLKGRTRLAGGLLVLSAGSAMGFAFIGNVLALAVGLANVALGSARRLVNT